MIKDTHKIFSDTHAIGGLLSDMAIDAYKRGRHEEGNERPMYAVEPVVIAANRIPVDALEELATKPGAKKPHPATLKRFYKILAKHDVYAVGPAVGKDSCD